MAVITQNHDIAGLCRRARRFKYEWAKSASGNVAAVSQFDADRLRSYLGGLRAYVSWVQSQPELDLPETHGERMYDLGDMEKLPQVENEAVVDMMNLFDVLELELMSSQSSRLHSKLISHDERRLLTLMDKMERFLEDYIMQIQPLDLPESSPLQAGVGAGRTGIKVS